MNRNIMAVSSSVTNVVLSIYGIQNSHLLIRINSRVDKEYKWVTDKTNLKKKNNFLERDLNQVSLKLIKSLKKRNQYKNPR